MQAFRQTCPAAQLPERETSSALTDKAVDLHLPSETDSWLGRGQSRYRCQSRLSTDMAERSKVGDFCGVLPRLNFCRGGKAHASYTSIVLGVCAARVAASCSTPPLCSAVCRPSLDHTCRRAWPRKRVCLWLALFARVPVLVIRCEHICEQGALASHSSAVQPASWEQQVQVD